MMLNSIRTSVISSSDITPHSLQHVFDGLEVLVHVPNNSLLELVVRITMYSVHRTLYIVQAVFDTSEECVQMLAYLKSGFNLCY